MDGFQIAFQCFLELLFGSAKLYDELAKLSFELFITSYSQMYSPSLQLQF